MSIMLGGDGHDDDEDVQIRMEMIQEEAMTEGLLSHLKYGVSEGVWHLLL